MMFIITPLIPRQEIVTRSETLATTRSANGENGTVLWGAGSHNETITFSFFLRNADGSLTPRHLRTRELIVVIEDESLKNEGTWTTHAIAYNRSSPLAAWVIFEKHEAVVVRHEFRVPTGTVAREFSFM